MRKSLICGLIVSAVVGLCSCRSKNAPDGTKAVSFSVLGLGTYTEALSQSRKADGSLDDANMTDLWIWEGTTLLAHQTSADEDWGTPAIELTYGEHTITFVASNKQNQSVEDGVFSAKSITDTYGYALTLTVDGSTAEQAVVLSRANSLIKWSSTDNLPQTASTLRVKVNPYRCQLGAGLVGTGDEEKEFAYDIVSYRGNTISVSVSTFPSENGEEENVSTTLVIEDNDGQELCRYTMDVPVLSNRRTVISGALFGSSASSPVSVHQEWDDDHAVSL